MISENIIQTTQDLGKAIRQEREAQGYTQAKLAALCGVGTRFISDLENGKTTLQTGKMLRVLQGMGLSLHVKRREFGRG